MLKFRFLPAGILLIMPLVSLFPQNKKIRENVVNGDYYYSQQKYPAALDFYLQVYQTDSNNYYLNYMIGECYMNMPEDWIKSKPYYLTASQGTTLKHAEVNFTKGFAPVEAFFRLGEVYQRNNELDSALHSFLDYKDQLPVTDKNNFENANFKIQSIAIAKGLIAEPLHVVESNLGPKINSRFSDYNPVITEDESLLIYTSFWESVDLIFMSHSANGKWDKPVDITKQIGSDGTFYTSALSADGKDLYLVEQDDYNSEIYVSHLTDTGWTFMEKLNNKINSLSHETSVTVSADGNFLFFSSNRPGGFGGFDIYCSEKKDGDWDKPKNLGEVINTPFDEEAPAITSDGKYLFFSSEGHRNMGGMDIFFSSFQEDGTWSKPQNIGYPINTTGDNLFYVPVKDGEIAYISKPADNGYGRNDIFRIEFPINEILQLALKEDIEMEKVNIEIDSIQNIPSDTNVIYTVQIMALRRDIGIKYFKEFDLITVMRGNDGLFRYITGNLKDINEARNLLEKVHIFGYRDAFIRTLNSLSVEENDTK